MKKKSKTNSSTKVMKEIKREVNAMHKATAEFVGVCIDIAKMHPKGLKRIKKHVDNVVNNMSGIEKMYHKMVK